MPVVLTLSELCTSTRENYGGLSAFGTSTAAQYVPLIERTDRDIGVGIGHFYFHYNLAEEIEIRISCSKVWV